MQETTFMRTTLDLPDDVLRRAKIAAVERGSSLRQLVIDALRHEMDAPSQNRRRRMTSPPIKLSADAPLRTLTPDEVKRLDAETEIEAEAARARALHR
jgi:hypothetical protein